MTLDPHSAVKKLLSFSPISFISQRRTQLLCCGLLMLFVAHTFFFMKVPFSRKFIAIFLSMDRFYASIAFTIILFLCHYGYADNLRKILSWKFFIVFEKLGLCIFIAHAFVLKWQFYTLQTPIYWNLSFMVSY